MVDILHYEKVRRFRGAGCYKNNYPNSYDPINFRKNEINEAGRRRRRQGIGFKHDYSIVVMYDPLDVGGFLPGTTFSWLEYNGMIQHKSFTPGTELTIKGVAHRISNNSERQRALKFKPASS